MALFQGRKHQRIAELLQQVQAAIEAEGGEPGGDPSHRIDEGLAEAAERAGVDLEVARLADLPTLRSVLAPGGVPDPAKCWAMAELLFLDGLRARMEEGLEAARPLLEKALGLYDLLEEDLDLPEGVPTPGERMHRIGELVAR